MTPSTQSLALIKWSKPGIIYVARNRVNGKLYVGQTVKSFRSRKRDHMYCAEHDSQFAFHVAIRKYGQDAFDFSIVQKCYGRDCLNAAEKWWITQLRSIGSNGYNQTTGGEGGTDSDETRKKKSEATKRRMTPERMAKFREKGQQALRGSTWTPERRKNHRINVSPEVLKRRMEGRKPYVASEEARRKISEGKKGKPRPDLRGKKWPGRGKGRIFSEEHRQNISKSKKGKPRPDIAGDLNWNRRMKKLAASKEQLGLDFDHGCGL